MSNLTISNFDAATGELEIKEMTPAEQQEYNQDIKRQQDKIKQDAETEADKAAAKASAQAKLAALGLTDDEVAAILGN